MATRNESIEVTNFNSPTKRRSRYGEEKDMASRSEWDCDGRAKDGNRTVGSIDSVLRCSFEGRSFATSTLDSRLHQLSRFHLEYPLCPFPRSFNPPGFNVNPELPPSSLTIAHQESPLTHTTIQFSSRYLRSWRTPDDKKLPLHARVRAQQWRRDLLYFAFEVSSSASTDAMGLLLLLSQFSVRSFLSYETVARNVSRFSRGREREREIRRDGKRRRTLMRERKREMETTRRMVMALGV